MPVSLSQRTIYHPLAAIEWRLFPCAFISFFKIKDIKITRKRELSTHTENTLARQQKRVLIPNGLEPFFIVISFKQ